MNKRLWILLFIGFANALPIPMSGSLLSIWLSEAGFDKRSIGFFALTALPFALKPLWFLPIHFFTPRYFASIPRKAWLCFALSGMGGSFLAISAIEPRLHPYLLAFFLSSLAVFTGCLYVVGLSYEIESLDEKEYSLGSAYVVSGYRLGLLFAGAGALYLSFLLSWHATFLIMALAIFTGGFFIWHAPEPYKSREILDAKKKLFASYPSIFHGFWQEMITRPLHLFCTRADWRLLLLLLLTFKIGDQLAKSMTGPFYLSIGFNKADLALAAKLWGFAATISGTMIFGYYFKGKNPFLATIQTNFLHSLSLICYFFLALTKKSFYLLYCTVAIENFTAGMAMASFISLLWKTCDKRYAVIQYTLLWSLFSLKSELFTCLGALLAAFCDWPLFFLLIVFISLFASLGVYKEARRAWSNPLTPASP